MRILLSTTLTAACLAHSFAFPFQKLVGILSDGPVPSNGCSLISIDLATNQTASQALPSVCDPSSFWFAYGAYSRANKAIATVTGSQESYLITPGQPPEVQRFLPLPSSSNHPYNGFVITDTGAAFITSTTYVFELTDAGPVVAAMLSPPVGLYSVAAAAGDTVYIAASALWRRELRGAAPAPPPTDGSQFVLRTVRPAGSGRYNTSSLVPRPAIQGTVWDIQHDCRYGRLILAIDDTIVAVQLPSGRSDVLLRGLPVQHLPQTFPRVHGISQDCSTLIIMTNANVLFVELDETRATVREGPAFTQGTRAQGRFYLWP